MCSANFLPIEDVSVCPTDGIGPTQGQRKTLTREESELTTFKGRGDVDPIPSVGLALIWSMGRKIALHITFYHSLYSKYKCYTVNLRDNANPTCITEIFNTTS